MKKCTGGMHQCNCGTVSTLDPNKVTIEITKPPGGEFKVGDKVLHVMDGKLGEVTGITDIYPPLQITYDDNSVDYFTTLSSIYTPYKYPVLSFISRPKQKVKKTIEMWANIYPGLTTQVNIYYDTETEVNKHAALDRIACVHLTGEYEVEE